MSVQLIGIYVSLDAILDTRIGTVDKLCGTDVAMQVLSENYHSRQDDKFPAVKRFLEAKAQEFSPLVDQVPSNNVDAYKEAYAKRDTETLLRSTLTGAMDFLQDITRVLMQQAISRPYHDGVRIVVNTYPYKLDEEEQQFVLAGLAAKMNAFTKVGIPFELETIVKSDAELTPKYCKENFSAMLMYEYENWFFAQQRAFIQSPAPEVTLYAPAIYHVQTPTEEELEECKRNLWTPFETVMKTARGWIDLKLIDVEHFSIVKPN